MLRSALSLAAILTSSPAFADIEVGAHTGINMVSMDPDGETHTGAAMGARFGYGLGLGLTPEINITSLNAKRSAEDSTTRVKQLQTGIGTRFYLGNFFMRPYASGHLTMSPKATSSISVDGSSEIESDIPGTGGMGMDIGGGLQLKILDLIYTEAFGTYAKEFGEAGMSTIYMGVGAGVKL